MPSLKTIRKRISSVKSTQKITRAMKMVAGARLNRAQQRIIALRPYAREDAGGARATSRAAMRRRASRRRRRAPSVDESRLTRSSPSGPRRACCSSC